jgi:hypothetical protein
MSLKSMGSFTSQRDLATMGVFACLFAALLLFRIDGWGLIAVSVLFIGYLSWAATAFFVRQQTFNTRNITIWVLPVGMAVFKVLLCLGVVWSIVWFVRRLFGL